MPCTTRIHYLELLLFRTCLEGSPADEAQRRAASSARGRSLGPAHGQLHQLKRKLLRAALEETPEAGLFKPLCGAANQAAELAWGTPFPLLFFPGLFAELARDAQDQLQNERFWAADAPSGHVSSNRPSDSQYELEYATSA